MKIIKQWKIKKIINYLTKSDPDKLMKAGEDKLIAIFQDAAKNVPAYKKLLKEYGLDPSKVTDIASFKRLVPIIDKSIFSKYDIAELCRNGDMSNMASASTSSGFSKEFSYVLAGKGGLEDFKLISDTLFDFYFNTSKKKTFLINSLGMGVRMNTDLPLAETSVKPDMVIAHVKKFAPCFEQIIIIGNTFFVKKIIEDGIEAGIDWKSIIVHLIIGEDWFPESYRTYLASLVGIDFDKPDDGMIISSMGISEIGTTLFQETHNKICMRRFAEKNANFRHALFGETTEISPILFHYYPSQVFLEEIDGELVFTSLGRNSLIPLIRYKSGDKGMIYTYDEVKAIASKFGYEEKGPEFKLPLVAVMGRTGKYIKVAKELELPALFPNVE